MTHIRREHKSLYYGIIEGSTSEVPLQNGEYKCELADGVFKLFNCFCNLASGLERRSLVADVKNFAHD